MEFIKVENRKDLLKIGLQDSKGNNIIDEEGNQVYWEFDLADIELPFKFSKMEEEHEKNVKWIKAQIIAIEKKADVKTKSGISSKDRNKMKAVKEFYEKEAKTLDIFLGKDGVKKFLNGRGYYIDMFEDILEALEQIKPLFDKNMIKIEDRIKEKYSNKESDVIE